MDLKKIFKDIIALIEWKKLLRKAYQSLRPKIAELVAGTSNKWDDFAFAALDTLAKNFLDFDESKDISKADLVTEAKKKLAA